MIDLTDFTEKIKAMTDDELKKEVARLQFVIENRKHKGRNTFLQREMITIAQQTRWQRKIKRGKNNGQDSGQQPPHQADRSLDDSAQEQDRAGEEGHHQ